MSPKLLIDITGVTKALGSAKLNEGDMLDIAAAGAAIVSNGQKLRVKVLSGETRATVSSHIEEASDTRVVDEIGPETEYARAIEYGREDQPNYPKQPFVRPTVAEDGPQIVKAISETYGNKVTEKWPT